MARGYRFAGSLIVIILVFVGIVSATSPVADFVGVPVTGTVPLNVAFSDASTGSPTGWAWFFGDEDYTAPWTLVNASPGWTGRCWHSSVVLPDGSIVLLGGEVTTYTAPTNDVWRSTDNGLTWTLVNSSAGWGPRRAQSSVAMPDGSIVVMGGYTDSWMNDVWMSPDKGVTWTQQTASAAWSPRYMHSSVVLQDGSILMMGGNNASGTLNDVWRSTDRGVTWTQMTSNAAWSARDLHTTVVMPDGSIILLGGEATLWGTGLNDVWRSTDKGATWTLVTLTPGWLARSGHSTVVMPDNNIVLFGGKNGATLLNDVWRSADNGVTWTQVTPGLAGWAPKAWHSSVAMPDGSIVVTGGSTNNAYPYRYSEVWRFQPDGSSSQNPSHTYTRPGTYSVALQAYNNDGSANTRKYGYITVTGSPKSISGFNGTPTSGTAPLTVAFTDTTTGSPTGWAWFFGDENYTAPWTLVNASPGWAGRCWHSSVVLPDGSIVLLGGEVTTYTAPTNDVWRSTDNGITWTLVNPSAGWTARRAQSCVAMPDGSIVLMGGATETLMNDVWRSTDNGVTWTQLTPNAAWSPRYSHSSVALSDGSIVLIGGMNASGTLNDVWRSTDNGVTWTQLTPNATWSPRYRHSTDAMPDGSIIIMGGLASFYGPPLNDVWRSTDMGATWTLVTPTSGWEARSGHSTVVMPDHNIVLIGGQSWCCLLNDVWRSADNGLTWIQVTPGLAGWVPKAWHSSVAMPDGSIVVTGGSDNNAYPYRFSEVWRFQPDGSSSQNPSHTYTRPGTYSVALQAYNNDGSTSMRKIDYITVKSSPRAIFFINRDIVVSSENNSLSSGVHDYYDAHTLSIYNSGPDLTDPAFGNLTYRIQTNNMGWVGYEPYAVWNATSSVWVLPPKYTVPVASYFKVLDSTGINGVQQLNMSMNRYFNQTKFTDTGYQYMGGNFTFTDLTATNIHLVIQVVYGAPFEGALFNASIVPGSFSTDAPVDFTGYGSDNVVAMLNKSALVVGKVYNYTAAYKIEPTTTAIQIEPMVDITLGGRTNSSPGTEGYSADMPSSLLPSGVTAVSASTDTKANWSYEMADNTVIGRLNFILRQVSDADFTGSPTSGKAPLTVQFTDKSTGSPTSWAWDFGDGSTTNATMQNPVHTFSSSGTYNVSLNVTGPNGYDAITKYGYITVTPTNSFMLVLSPGWNFVSTPKKLEIGNNTAEIFGSIDTDAHSIWQYDTSGRHWVAITPKTRINVLDGIWIYSRTEDHVTLHFSKDPLTAPPERTCFQGWNAIGFSDTAPIDARSALLSVHDSWSTLIGYDAGIQKYESSIINGGSGSHNDDREMQPGKGYWLYMNDDNQLSAISV